MPTDAEIQAALEAANAAAKAEADAKAKAEADEIAASGITTDAGKEALRKEREARRNAEKAAKDAMDRAAALEAKQAEADKAKAAAEEADAIKRGEFEQLATARAEEIKTLTGDRDATRSQLDTLIASIKPDVDEAWKALPEEVSELFTGDANDVLSKKAFMASHKKLIDRLADDKQKTDQRYTGIPKTPRPNGGVPIDAAMDQQRRVGNYKV